MCGGGGDVGRRSPVGTHVGRSSQGCYQVQLDWWFKQYLFIPQETLDKQLAVALKSTDYSHIKNDKNKTTQGAFLDPKNLFQFLYPNSYLSFIKYYGENIEMINACGYRPIPNTATAKIARIANSRHYSDRKSVV